MTREVEEQKRYRVWMRSFPGFYEQYDGKVDVWAWNETDAEEKAFMELKRGAFPDRSRSMWRVEKVERLEA
jgi:hypothetical protein